MKNPRVLTNDVDCCECVINSIESGIQDKLENSDGVVIPIAIEFQPLRRIYLQPELVIATSNSLEIYNDINIIQPDNNNRGIFRTKCDYISCIAIFSFFVVIICVIVIIFS